MLELPCFALDAAGKPCLRRLAKPRTAMPDLASASSTTNSSNSRELTAPPSSIRADPHLPPRRAVHQSPRRPAKSVPPEFLVAGDCCSSVPAAVCLAAGLLPCCPDPLPPAASTAQVPGDLIVRASSAAPTAASPSLLHPLFPCIEHQQRAPGSTGSCVDPLQRQRGPAPVGPTPSTDPAGPACSAPSQRRIGPSAVLRFRSGVVRIHSTTTVCLLHGLVFLPCGISGKMIIPSKSLLSLLC
ncbi:hypothetical protein VPH35_050472 [Triticum aestivum]